MKKLIILILIVLICLTVTSAVNAYQREAIGMVLSVNSDSLDVLIIDEMEEIFEIYNLKMSSYCWLPDFAQSDLIMIELSEENNLVDGIIAEKISLDDFSSNLSSSMTPVALSNCEISKAQKQDDLNTRLYIMAEIKNNDYAMVSIDMKEYLVEDTSNCLDNQVNDISIVMIDQNNLESLTTDDKFLYALNIDLSNFEMQLNEIKSCSLGVVNEVDSTSVKFLETDVVNSKVIVHDIYKDVIMSIELAESCNAISNDDLGYGEITYLSEDNTPVYLSFSDLDFSDIDDFSENYQDRICEIKNVEIIDDYELIVDDKIPDDNSDEDPFDFLNDNLGLFECNSPNINIPEITNFYIGGKYNRKVYTDRPKPQDMICGIVKGETDHATYIVGTDGKLRWMKSEAVAKRLFGNNWDSQIMWFSDSIIYTYEIGEPIKY